MRRAETQGETPALRKLAVAFALVLLLAIPGKPFALENEAVGAAIERLFAEGKADTGSTGTNVAIGAVRDFYAARGFKPVWTRDGGPKGKARALLAELKISAAHGLSPKFYRTGEIEALMGATAPADLARLDMLLTGAFSEFAADLANGRVTSRVAKSINAVEPVAVSVTGFVEQAEEAGDLRQLAGGLLAADDRYVRLMAKLAELTRLEASGRWPKIEAGGKPIASGKSDGRMEAIRLLLALSGDLELSLVKGGPVHDRDTQQAVRSFQSRHGLKPTGEIDAATLGETAIPLKARMAQIRLNLERRRWQNLELAADHLYINLADMQARLVRAGREDRFFAVAPQAGLEKLPTFYARIIAAENAGGGRRLVLDSAHLAALAGKEGEGQLALRDIDAIAKAVLDENGGTSAAGRTELARPLQVFVTYVTAWANRDGSVEYRPDRLGRDPVLAALLAAQ